MAKITVEVQAAFAHCTHPGISQKGLEFGVAVAVPAARIVWVHTCGAEQMLGAIIQLSAEFQGVLAFALEAGTG